MRAKSGSLEVYQYPEARGSGTAGEAGNGSGLGSEADWARRLEAAFPNLAESEGLGSQGNGAMRGSEPGRVSAGGVPGGVPEGIADPEAGDRRLAAERKQAEELGQKAGFDRGIAQGLAQGRAEAGRQFAAEKLRLQSQVGSLLESFAESRAGYVHQLEQESVRLALAIAARILRREAQMDALLLTGAVRVALGQLSDATIVRMRVPATDQPLWAEAMALLPNLKLRPEVVAEEGMELGECRLETELGSADLSLWSQLREIERGFFDRVGGQRDVGMRQDGAEMATEEMVRGSGVPEGLR